MATKKKPIGRPKKLAHEVREIILKIRLSTIENAAFIKTAKAFKGGEVSTWARNVLRKYAGLPPDDS